MTYAGTKHSYSAPVVVVIGGGLAGLSAGLRGREIGAEVIVLEQGTDAYPCNTRYSGAAFHVGYQPLDAEPAQLEAAIEACTMGYADASLARRLASDASKVATWLSGHGVRFAPTGPAGYQQFTVAPATPRLPGLNWRGVGGDVLLGTLETAFKRRGGRLERGYSATALRTDDGGAVVGVFATAPDGTDRIFDADAVVIADGGFQSDHDLLRRHVTTVPAALLQRGGATGLGSGLRMALEVGAASDSLQSFYGHLMSREALDNAALWPHPVMDFIAAAGIVVDSVGRRIADEGLGGVYLANAIARLPDPLSTFAIFDEPIWVGAPGTAKMVAPNPHLESVGGTIHRSQDLVGLALRIGVPPETLQTTIKEYNAALDSGMLTRLSPQRTSNVTFTPYGLSPWAIRTPPYFAVPLCAGITYTTGGIVIDDNARVLDQQGRPIQGLLAAGAATAGLEGGLSAGYSGGLAKAAIFGYRAAETASKIERRTTSTSIAMVSGGYKSLEKARND